MPEVAPVVLGGTFDRLHIGHATLLNAALRVGGPVAIGLTTDDYLRAHPKIDGGRMRLYVERRRTLTAWLRRHAPHRRWTVVPLSDRFGRSITPGVRVLVASVETRRGALAVNRERRLRGLPPVRIVLVPLVLGEDLAPITSTRIREGIIDTKGRRRAPIRIGLFSSSPETARAFRTGARAVFRRPRFTVTIVRPTPRRSAESQVRGWSRRALKGNDLGFALVSLPGPAAGVVLSERSSAVELFPRRLTGLGSPSPAVFARCLRPAAHP
jgi:pantetheine-phosphate adenylyltransferase